MSTFLTLMLYFLICGVGMAISQDVGTVVMICGGVLIIVRYVMKWKQSLSFYNKLANNKKFRNLLEEKGWMKFFDTELELKKFAKSEKKAGRLWDVPALASGGVWETYRKDLKKKMMKLEIK